MYNNEQVKKLLLEMLEKKGYHDILGSQESSMENIRDKMYYQGVVDGLSRIYDSEFIETEVANAAYFKGINQYAKEKSPYTYHITKVKNKFLDMTNCNKNT